MKVNIHLFRTVIPLVGMKGVYLWVTPRGLYHSSLGSEPGGLFALTIVSWEL